ncbi:lysozyme-like [Dreissena polymorpha]|uniref:lysozyme n=1 Tax=Dreissena polymorpha TaxID=45954 RepID=A0A9D4MT67_DREPO|nr:lysozyme-like [Dreissena polymorpha]KAH3883432.1 hypothetical protein DPMN_007387 [Dreissena polymorpha]
MVTRAILTTVLVVTSLTSAFAAPATGACLCVTTTGVNVRESASIHSHVVIQATTGDCFHYSGHSLIADGHTWYQLANVHGHQNVWIASEFLHVSLASQCTTGSGSGSGVFATGMVSQECLQCICTQESGCRPLGCHDDVGTPSCGYFQIKEVYWIDCGRPGNSWPECAADKHCSSQCVQNNMKRYAAHGGCPLSCEGYARIHNGGPNGCHKDATLAYWHRLQSHPGCSNVH